MNDGASESARGRRGVLPSFKGKAAMAPAGREESPAETLSDPQINYLFMTLFWRPLSELLSHMIRAATIFFFS